MRTLLAILLAGLVAMPVHAQTTWAVPDSGGGFITFGEHGIGTITPDSGGGYIIRQPDPPPAPARRNPAPLHRPIEQSSQDWSSLNATIPGTPQWLNAQRQQQVAAGQGRGIRCDALRWTIRLDPVHNAATVHVDPQPGSFREPLTFSLAVTPAYFDLQRVETREGTHIDVRLSIERIGMVGTRNFIFDGVIMRPEVDTCRMIP